MKGKAIGKNKVRVLVVPQVDQIPNPVAPEDWRSMEEVRELRLLLKILQVIDESHIQGRDALAVLDAVRALTATGGPSLRRSYAP